MIVQIMLIAWAAAAAGFDASRHRLPNWLTLGGLFGGALYALANGVSLLGGDAANAMLAAACAFLVLLPAYLAGWMGAGDVKLFAAMGMLGGGKVLLPTLLIGSIAGGVGALLFLVFRKKRSAAQVPGERTLPFGVGLALGFALSVLDIFPALVWRG